MVVVLQILMMAITPMKKEITRQPSMNGNLWPNKVRLALRLRLAECMVLEGVYSKITKRRSNGLERPLSKIMLMPNMAWA